jgi:hypothetical protein
MVPETKAESNLPEGAIVTDRDSIMSTYSSFEVCRTPERRQGIAGPWDALAAASDCFRGLVVPSVGVEALDGSKTISNASQTACINGVRFLPRYADTSEELPHPPRYLHNLLQHIGFRVTHDSAITYLMKQLRHNLIIRLYLGRKQRGADKLLEYIDHAMQEL